MADRTKKISEFPSLLDPNGNTRILASHTSNSGATNTYNLSIQKLSDTIFQLEVPTATTNIKGIVKVGNNLSINSSGHLSATLGNYVTFTHLNANFPNFNFVNTTFVTINSLSSYVTVNTLSNYATVTILNNAIANLAMNALPTTANNTYYVGDIPASEVVSSTQLQDNLANYMLLSDMYTHVTTTTLADNVATLTANNTFYVGSVTAANVVSNAQLQDNLANYATTSSLSSYVTSTDLSNNLSNYALTSSLSSYQTTAGLASNVQTLTANNANNLGGVAAASYVQNTDSRTLSGNLTFSSYLTAGIGASSVLRIGAAEEGFTSYSSVTGSFTFNCVNGNIFYASSVTGNFTPVFTNYVIDSGYAVGFTIVLNQGATPYAPTSNLTLGVGGSNVTVNWQGTTAPSGTANKIDVVTYSVLNNSGTYTVLGQLTSFG